MNYYEVLEIPSDAPQNEVHRAYQRAKTTYAQDNPALYSMFSRDEARELLRMVEEAYAILSNHALRKSYDDTLVKAGLHSLAKTSPFGAPKAGPTNTSVMPSEADHASLPDFMVPDPSIPGSTDHQLFNASPMSVVPAVPSPSHFSEPNLQSTSMNQATQHIQGSSADVNFQQEPQPMLTPAPQPEVANLETVFASGEDFSVRRRDPTVPTSVPAGHVKLPLGTYKIDAQMEAKIAAQTLFDGPFLRMVREYRCIPMDKLSETSRIGKTYLLAIEGNDMRSLPAAVFLRGFLVQIAKHLGLDEKLVVNSYLNMVKENSKK